MMKVYATLRWMRSLSLPLSVSHSAPRLYAFNAPQDRCRTEIVQKVVELLKDDDRRARQTALEAIAKLSGIGESSSYSFTFVSNPPQVDCHGQMRKTVQPVVDRLQDDDHDVCQAALSAISQLVVVGLSINFIFILQLILFKGNAVVNL